MTNLLMNGSFEGSTYKPKGQMALVLPQGWMVGWLDDGRLVRADPTGATQFGTYRKNGPRNASAPCLKPEILVIKHEPPYLDPLRVDAGNQAVTGFKSWGILWFWMAQRASVTPGSSYRFSARAHAWSRLDTDPNDAHYSNGVGTGAFFALAGAAGLNDGQRNFIFRVGIDPFGSLDPTGSAVVWGKGAHIYNAYDDIPSVEVMARADSVTVFVEATSLYGMINSNTYFDAAVLESIAVEPPPPSGRGAPRVQYARVYHVIPQSATPARAAEIAAAAWAENKCTVGGSYDDAGVGDLDIRVAKCWDITLAERQAYLDWFAEHYAGVQVEFLPKVEPPSPPALTANKGGLHIVVQGSHNGLEDYLRRCAEAGKPVGLIKVMKDGGAAHLAKEISPKTITVWRWFSGKDYEDDTPAGNWQWASSASRQVARDWMKWLYPIWEPDREWVDYFEFLNEPDPADANGIARASEFVQYCMEDAEAHGFKTAIWSWTAGLPRTPSILPSDFPQAEATLETLKWAAEHGHALSVHDGSVNDERRLFRQAYEDKTALRYRYVKALMDAKGWPMPYVVITEAYQVDGYRKPDWDDWKWYLRELGKDDYVLGCAWFTLGDYEFSPGQSVNVAAQLPGFAQVCIEASGTVPPPPPLGNVWRGLHLRADGPNTDADFECVRVGRIEAAKILSSTPPEDFDRLVALGIRPDRIIMRLFADLTDRTVSPREFCEWMYGPLDWFVRRGGLYVEIHNEPNLPQEGLYQSWMSAAGWANWYMTCLNILSGWYPDLKFGHPGLSPQPDIGAWLAACDEALRASDWIGAHAYWVARDQMTHPNHGAHWQSYLQFGRPVMITEFANVNPHTSKFEKGRQYREYYAWLRSCAQAPLGAFAFVSSASSLFDRETWAETDGTLSEIPVMVGA